MNYKKPKATLLHATPLSVSEVAARCCYNSFNASPEQTIRDFKINLSVEDIDSSELLNKLTWVHQHGSINEHVNLSYYVDNVSREVIIEWNRHRLGIATSQQSTRYTMEDVVNAWVDYNNGENYSDFEEAVAKNIIDLDPAMINITAKYMSAKLSIYNHDETLIKGLTGSKKKKQNDRVKRCLPEVWIMDGVWTFNLRALKHFYNLRNSGAAYYGIREAVETILEATPQKYLDLIVKGN
jgi:thymidylate synthase (FAD)